MQTIHKFELKLQDSQLLALPKGAEILTVQVQYGNPYLWVRLDTSVQEFQAKTVITRGTGHPVEEEPVKYIGTYQLDGGRLVFHVLEVL